MNDPRDEAAMKAEQAAKEAEVVAAHLRTAAGHLRERQVPRYAAHLLAAQGHLINVRRLLDDLSVTHASRSRPLPEDERP